MCCCLFSLDAPMGGLIKQVKQNITRMAPDLLPDYQEMSINSAVHNVQYHKEAMFDWSASTHAWSETFGAQATNEMSTAHAHNQQ